MYFSFSSIGASVIRDARYEANSRSRIAAHAGIAWHLKASGSL